MNPVDDGGDVTQTAPAAPVASGESADHITLSLDDLLPDSNGEIVVTSQQGQLYLSLVTDLPVCEQGVADTHVTADGTDVNGLSFYAFEGGMRLYYSPDVEITIASHAA